jgi:hypothetical protein
MSIEFEVGGHTYRANKLAAKKQFHVTRRLSPLLVGLIDSGVLANLRREAAKGAEAEPGKLLDNLTDKDLGGMLGGVLANLASLPEPDVDYIIDACLAVTERRQDSGGWARLMTGDLLQFQDLDMPAMLKIVWEVLRLNLSGFFGEGSPISGGAPLT